MSKSQESSIRTSGDTLVGKNSTTFHWSLAVLWMIILASVQFGASFALASGVTRGISIYILVLSVVLGVLYEWNLSVSSR
jgi:hypothetical protein